MREFIVVIAILFAIFIPISQAQANDIQSLNSHYNQYSPDNLSSSSSQYESQYSPKNVSNPYSQFEVQYSPKNVISPFAQQDHDYKANIVGLEAKGKKGKANKGSVESAYLSKFFEAKKPRSIPVFFYLLVASSLALGATIFILIGVFKK